MRFFPNRNISLKLDEKGLLFLILGASLLIRLINIDMPLLEGSAVRQVQTASIARFFYHNGFHILRSRLDFFPKDIGYLVLEFPLYNMLLASFYRLAGGVNEWIGRLLSILFFMGSGFFVFLIIRQLYNYKTALIGLAVYNLSPLGIIFSRAVMPDSEMLFFCTGAVFFMLQYTAGGKRRSFWLSSFFVMAALLVKIQSFHILLPLGYLIFYRQRSKCFIDYKTYLFFIIAAMPAVLWYSYVAFLHRMLFLERLQVFQVSNWFNPSLFFTAALYKDVLKIISCTLLTPVGFVLFLLGMTVKRRDRIEMICFAWLGGIALYLLAFNALYWEAYYYLPLLPIASIFIARVFSLDWTMVIEKSYLSARWGRVLASGVMILFIARYAIYAYVIPAGYGFIPEAAEVMRRLSSPGDSMVVVQPYGGSALLYYCRREGWILKFPESKGLEKIQLIDDSLEEFKRKGARYLFVSKEDGLSLDLLRQHLDKKYTLLEHKKDRYIIYKLK